MHPQIIVMGTSAGGLKALGTVLGALSPDFPLPIAIVQHRSKSSTEELAAMLQSCSCLRVREAEDKDNLTAATVYLAPADYHLLIERGYCALSLEAPLGYARPSIDILFESAASAYGSAVLAVVLTGNNSDGADGAAQIKASGGTVIVQDPNDSEGAAMPKATIECVPVDQILKLSEIAPYLMNCCQTQELEDNG